MSLKLINLEKNVSIKNKCIIMSSSNHLQIINTSLSSLNFLNLNSNLQIVLVYSYSLHLFPVGQIY